MRRSARLRKAVDSGLVANKLQARSVAQVAAGAAGAMGAQGASPNFQSQQVSQMRKLELELSEKGFVRIAGVDEAGRGPLAGPVVAAACHVPLKLKPMTGDDLEWLDRVADSKTLTEADREELYEKLTTHPDVRWSVHCNSAQTIDQINILQATMGSMHSAVEAMSPRPDFVLVDGNRLPWGHAEAERADGSIRPADPAKPKGLKDAEAVVKGDAKVLAIAAASIIAKVTRDRMMLELDSKYPLYQLKSHKGYGTRAHIAAIHKHGPCPEIHRMTFAPLKHIFPKDVEMDAPPSEGKSSDKSKRKHATATKTGQVDGSGSTRSSRAKAEGGRATKRPKRGGRL